MREEGEDNAVEFEVEFASKKTHGIKKKDGSWYNLSDGLEKQDKDALIKAADSIGPGDKVRLEIDRSGKYHKAEITKKAERDRFDDDRDIVSFDDVLKQAHEKFGEKLSIETQIIQSGPEWLFKATVRITIDVKANLPHMGYEKATEQVFTGHGDATTENVGSPNVQKALPRMAETRAIARALRFALGTTIVTEEMSEDKYTSMPPENAEKGQKNANNAEIQAFQEANTPEKGQKALISKPKPAESMTQKCSGCGGTMKKTRIKTPAGLEDIWQCEDCEGREPV